MKIEIEKVDWEKDKQNLSVLLNQLPAWRLEKALSFHFDIDKYLCAKSFLILQKMLFDEYQIKEFSPFSYGKCGKPYLQENLQIHFNISHCKKGIACVVNDAPVGIDIEEIYLDQEVAEQVLSDEEFQIVQNSKFPKQEFIKYWTMKESYLKLTGKGLIDEMKNVLKSCKDQVEFKTFKDEKFITTIAFEK